MHLRCSLRRRSTPGGVGKAQLQIIQIAVEERHAGPVYLREPFASPTIDGTEAPRPEDQATEDDEDDADRLGRDQFRDPQGDQQDAHLPGRFHQTPLVLLRPRRSLRDRRSNWDRRTTRRWRECAVHDELLYGCLSLVTIEPLAASPLAALNRGWSCVLKTTSVPESRPVTTVRRPPGSTDLTVLLSSSSRKISETAVCSPTITGVPGPGSVGACAAAQFPRVVARSGTENRISWSVPSVVPISVLTAGSKDLIVLTMSADGSIVKAKVRGRWNRIDISPRRKPRSARATHPIAD